MLRKLAIIDGKLTQAENGGLQVSHFIDPTEEERRFLVEQAGIDAHTLSSSLDPDELGRLEFEPSHIALIIKRPKQYQSEDNFLFKINSVGLFLFSDRLIIVTAEDTLAFDGKVFQQVKSLADLILKIICRSIHHFEEHLKVVSMITDELEHEISCSMENRHLLHMFTIEKSLVYYLNAIGSNRRVIDKIRASSAKLGLTTEDIEYLDDVVIENSQCHELAETYSQVLSGLMDARVSIVSNNLNVLMKTLTLVMIGIMVPTLVISAFSMNVKMPLFDENAAWAFWFIIALATASAAGVFAFWRYKRW
jgi:magnesium transporter